MAITLDIETANTFERFKHLPRTQQLKKMIFGIAVTYDDTKNEFKEWGIKDLIPLWEYIVNQTVLGWNVISFDIPVIRYTLQGDGYPADQSIMTFDLFHSIKTKTNRWYSLNSVIKATLNREKTADGLDAAKWLEEWLRTQDEIILRKALDYCRMDVELEYALYKHLQSGQHLVLPMQPEKKFFTEMHYLPTGKIKEI